MLNSLVHRPGLWAVQPRANISGNGVFVKKRFRRNFVKNPLELCQFCQEKIPGEVAKHVKTDSCFWEFLGGDRRTLPIHRRGERATFLVRFLLRLFSAPYLLRFLLVLFSAPSVFSCRDRAEIKRPYSKFPCIMRSELSDFLISVGTSRRSLDLSCTAARVLPAVTGCYRLLPAASSSY